MAARSVTRLVRQPAAIIPSVIFPLFLLAVNAGGLNAATDLPGFPTDSYITFAIAFTFIQSAIFSTMNAGQSLAQDIENGFFSRLVLTPMRPSALMAGQLVGLVLLGQFQALLYFAVGIAAGAGIVLGIGDHDRFRRAFRQPHGVLNAVVGRIDLAVEVVLVADHQMGRL